MVDAVAINDHFALDMRMWPEFQTTIIPLAGGYEDRNQDHVYALWRYEVELRNRPIAEITEFVTFVMGRRGAARSFRVRNPIYNQLTEEQIGTGNGSQTQFQIVQLFNDPVNPYSHPWYAVADLTVKKAGVIQTTPGNYSQANGLITFTAAPGVGQAITVTAETFSVCRFDTDVNPVVLPIAPDFASAFASAGPFTLREVPA